MSLLLDVLRHLPLVSASAWLSLASFQVYRDRYHTWSETFFLFACFFAGIYAITDWFLFTTRSDFGAHVATVLSFASIALAELFFLLFTFVYVDRMRTRYWSFALIALGVLLLIPTVLVQGTVAPAEEGGLYLPALNLAAMGIFLLYVMAYGSTGIWNLYRVYRIVRNQSRVLARKAGGLVVSFAMVLLLGIVTNGYLGLTGNTQIPPPFSSLLLIVALVAGYTLYPGTRERVSVAIRKFMARRYEIKAVFLVHQNGTLVGSRSQSVDAGMDQDLFSATLDVIQNFMRTSFPILRGTSLRTIEHGNFKILVERGRFCYITMVLAGEENDLLRRQMRDELLAFEEANAETLRNWKGVQREAVGTQGALERLFAPPELFGR